MIPVRFLGTMAYARPPLSVVESTKKLSAKALPVQ
jgi:hypothetical protein